jgi:hypothetical protein
MHTELVASRKRIRALQNRKKGLMARTRDLETKLKAARSATSSSARSSTGRSPHACRCRVGRTTVARARLMAGQASPLFSIVTPVYQPPVDVLADTIASVRAQEHTDWEWVLVDDASPDPEVRQVIADASADDPRIRLVARDTNGHIVAASNDAVAEATGEFLVFLDHDDLLTPTRWTRWPGRSPASPRATTSTPTRDKVGEDGEVFGRFAKPDWSPERLRGQMYTSHLSVMRTALVREVGGFRQGYDGSQDHDLALRVSERARPGRPRPAGALPLACGGRVRRGRHRRQALRRRRGASRGAGPARPAGDRRQGSESGRERGATSSSAALDPRCASRS